MTTQAEAARIVKHQAGIYCTYCKQRKPEIALYRVREATYKGQCRGVVYAVCADPACIEKAHHSRVADQWIKW